MRRIDNIVLHCSDSPYGDAGLIDAWHRQRGFDCIGYHYVVCNAYPNEESYRLKRPQFEHDGVIQEGRPRSEAGAHVKGHNRNSIGICLIGERLFTYQQYAALLELLNRLKKDHPALLLYGHYELQQPEDKPKTCPNIDMDWLRERVGSR